MSVSTTRHRLPGSVQFSLHLSLSPSLMSVLKHVAMIFHTTDGRFFGFVSFGIVMSVDREEQRWVERQSIEQCHPRMSRPVGFAIVQDVAGELVACNSMDDVCIIRQSNRKHGQQKSIGSDSSAVSFENLRPSV